MKIVIAGAGEVGSHLARMLSGSRHDIVVIDEDQKLLDDIGGISDIVTIEGDPTTFSVLRKASVRKADLFIGVYHEESYNIISATLAKQLGARKSIARIDNDEYLEPNHKEIFISMGIDYLFNPEMIAALEVTDLLGHSAATEYVDFSDGKLALAVFKLDPSSPLVGLRLMDLSTHGRPMSYRTVAITRGGETIIPRGDDRFMEEDTIYVVTESDRLPDLTEYAGQTDIDVKSMMILGGSRIGVRIARELQEKVDIKLVEYNEGKAYRIAEQLDKTLIINDDGRDIDAMLEEGLSNMDAFVAVTGRSETNILTAMYAKKMGVKKVIAEVENLSYINLAESIGIDTIINKKLVTASNIFRFTLSSDIQSVKYLTGSDAEVLEFIAKPNSPATKQRLRDLDFPHDAIIGGIVRGERVIIAVGDTEIQAYDRVVVFAMHNAIPKVARFFN